MERRGWVKEDAETSGKEKTFVLAEEGKALIKKVLPARLEVQQRLMTALTNDELDLLLSLCSKLKAASEADA